MGNLSGIIAIVMWSFSALFISYSGHVPPFLMASLVFGISFLIYIPIWAYSNKNMKVIFNESKQSYIVGVGGISGYVALYYFGLKTAPIVEANLVNYLWPIFIIIFSSFILKQKMNVLEIVGILLGFIGAFFILKKDVGSVGFDLETFYVYLPALGAAVVWGVYSTLTKKVLFDKDFMGVIFLISAVIMLVIHLFFESRSGVEFQSFVAILLLGLTATSYSFWDYGMKKGDVNFLASCSYLIPLFSTLLLILFGRGDLSANIAVGGALIIFGCLLSNASKIRSMWGKNGRH